MHITSSRPLPARSLGHESSQLSQSGIPTPAAAPEERWQQSRDIRVFAKVPIDRPCFSRVAVHRPAARVRSESLACLSLRSAPMMQDFGSSSWRLSRQSRIRARNYFRPHTSSTRPPGHPSSISHLLRPLAPSLRRLAPPQNLRCFFVSPLSRIPSFASECFVFWRHPTSRAEAWSSGSLAASHPFALIL